MLEKIKKAVLGDSSNQTIKAGTLVTTRGIGVVIVGLIGGLVLLEQLDYGPWMDLNTWQKFTFVIGGGFIWALVAAGDAIARGLSAGPSDMVVPMPANLRATYLAGEDSVGWLVAAVRVGASADPEFLIVKGTSHRWAKAAELRFAEN